MGSGSSRLVFSPAPAPSSSSPTSTSKVNRTKHCLASFMCGSSSSSQREDCAAESLVNSTGNCLEVTKKLSSPTNESILTLKGGTGFTSRSSPRSEPGASSEISTTSSEHTSVDEPHFEAISNRRCFPENNEVVPLPHINAANEHYQHRLVDTANESCTGQIQPVDFNSKRLTTSDFHDPVGSDLSQVNPEVISPTPNHVQHNELERLPESFEEINEAPESLDFDNGQISVASDPVVALQSQNDEAIQEVLVPSGLGHLVPDRVQASPEGSVLHVDMVSISSNILPNINNEISIREARRNSRRMFWDSFSSRSSRRHTDFPAILFTTEDADFMGSRRRWILDIGDDLLDDGIDVEPWHFGRRNRATIERRHNTRSEFWDSLRGASSESSHRTTCPYDLHPDGSCSCELDEEASFLTSISRIVLLAEALFGVLDEIHRQPESFPLSMLSIPAPESVVDALPIRTYEKTNTAEADSGDEVDQCYICLVDYEEGDKIRVLPCLHEYHMSCVDRWLKEVHGVCPLCRGDVRGETVREGSASASSNSSDASLT